MLGAELFAERSATAGRRLGVIGLAVDLLLAGAEPEELITAVTAAARDRPGIAVGDAIGANLTMLTLTLGLAALVALLPLRGRVRCSDRVSSTASLISMSFATEDGNGEIALTGGGLIDLLV